MFWAGPGFYLTCLTIPFDCQLQPSILRAYTVCVGFTFKFQVKSFYKLIKFQPALMGYPPNASLRIYLHHHFFIHGQLNLNLFFPSSIWHLIANVCA